MAAIERRRFVTRTDVDDAHAAGQPLRLAPRDVLTDEAATRARDLGVAVERAGTARQPGRPAAPAAAPVAAKPADDTALRAAIRAAVEAELGPGTPGIDAAIDRVFARRSARPG